MNATSLEQERRGRVPRRSGTVRWSPTEATVAARDPYPDRWRATLRRFYDAQDVAREAPAKLHFYYQQIITRLQHVVEPNSRVLDIGCGRGEMLAALRPSYGVGVDFSERQLRDARQRFPALHFRSLSAESVHELTEPFDYVVLSQVLGEIYDLQSVFRSIQHVCHARTRIVIVHYSRVWQPALKLMEWLRIKRRPPEQNWLPSDEVMHLLRLSGFETIRRFGMTLMPLPVPLLAGLSNRWLANLPLANSLGLNYVIVARPVQPNGLEHECPSSVSVVVPARNEAGHIRGLLRRIPRLAVQQEVLFIEGGSTDDTWEAIRREAAEYAGPLRVRCLQQDGRGKGDAVRKGFAAATGDVLMILDADLSVPPEELSSFYETLATGQGEFVNGSRMVYLMDAQAMRFLNLLANKMFGWVFTYLLNQRFRDTLCGTKVLRRTDYERIAANRAYFGDFDPFGDFDLLFGAARLNLKIVDVPVHYKARIYGTTNISRFRHGWALLRMCAFAARKIKFL